MGRPLASGDAEIAAHVAHEANRAYCRSLGDHSQSPWDAAPEWQKASAREGIAHVARGAAPATLHDLWAATKLRDGWRFGPEKNSERRTHPCLVAYADLPEEQRRKDAIFHAVVAGVLSALGYTLPMAPDDIPTLEEVPGA